MKKLLCLASILVTSVVLAACGNNNSPATDRDHNANDNLNHLTLQQLEHNTF